MPAIIEAQCVINAPIEKVWDALVDLDNYHTWNTFTSKIETDFSIGSTVVLHVHLNLNEKIHIQKETMLEYIEGESMSWGITKSFPVKTVRIQKLTKINKSKTSYYTSDVLNGLMTPIVMALYGKKIKNGFDQVAIDLKNYCESLSTSQQ